MSTARDNAVELLNKGIAEKRNGNFDEALDYYEQAKSIYSEYPVIYMNMAKIFILQGKYEHAFRNLLINVHLRIIAKEEFSNPDYEQQYRIDNQELKKVRLNNNAVVELLKESSFNEQIAKEINVTFYAGLSYTGLNPSFLKHHKISKRLIESEKDVLAGRIPNSENLRQSKFVNLINIIGLKWLIDNVNSNLQDQNEICSYYIDSTTEIKKPDTKIFNAKAKAIHEYTWWEVIKMLLLMPIVLIPEFFKNLWGNIIIKDKKFHKRIIDIIISPFLIIFGPIFIIPAFIIMKATGTSITKSSQTEVPDEKDVGSPEVNGEEFYDEDKTSKNTEEVDQQYEDRKSQFRKKSVLEELAEVTARAEMEKEEGFAGMILNIMELIYLHTQNKIEYKFIKESDNDQFSLFLQMEIDDYTLGIGNSNKLETYQCMLIKHLKFDEKDDVDGPDGIYEFEITNFPSIGFSHPSSKRNLSKKIYIENSAFEKQTLRIIGSSGDYDNQLINTIGLERYISNRSS